MAAEVKCKASVLVAEDMTGPENPNWRRPGEQRCRALEAKLEAYRAKLDELDREPEAKLRGVVLSGTTPSDEKWDVANCLLIAYGNESNRVERQTRITFRRRFGYHEEWEQMYDEWLDGNPVE